MEFMEVFRFRYYGHIFVMMREVVKMGAAFVLMPAELFLDLSLLCRLELLLNHRRFFLSKGVITCQLR